MEKEGQEFNATLVRDIYTKTVKRKREEENEQGVEYVKEFIAKHKENILEAARNGKWAYRIEGRVKGSTYVGNHMKMLGFAVTWSDEDDPSDFCTISWYK